MQRHGLLEHVLFRASSGAVLAIVPLMSCIADARGVLQYYSKDLTYRSVSYALSCDRDPLKCFIFSAPNLSTCKGAADEDTEPYPSMVNARHIRADNTSRQ